MSNADVVAGGRRVWGISATLAFAGYAVGCGGATATVDAIDAGFGVNQPATAPIPPGSSADDAATTGASSTTGANDAAADAAASTPYVEGGRLDGPQGNDAALDSGVAPEASGDGGGDANIPDSASPAESGVREAGASDAGAIGTLTCGASTCTTPAQICCYAGGGAPSCTPVGQCAGTAVGCRTSADCAGGDVCDRGVCVPAFDGSFGFDSSFPVFDGGFPRFDGGFPPFDAGTD